MMEDKFESAQKEIERLDNYYPNSDLSHVYKKHREQIISIAHCVEEIKKNKEISASNLQILEQGAKNSWEEVFYYQAGRYLTEFSFKYDNARELFYRLSNDKDYKVRFRVVTILLNEPRKKIIKDVLKRAFNDKSQIVREKAEDVLNRLNSKRRFCKIRI